MAVQSKQDERGAREGAREVVRARTLSAPIVWLVGTLLIGLALRFWAAMQPVNTLLLKTLPDDAFYYFTIARNIAGGYGVTFDQLAPTNGFHPLWMVLITPLFALAEGDRAVQLSLMLGALLDAVSALLLFRIVHRLTGRADAGVLGALLYFLSPAAWMSSLNGLETAVNTMTIALVVERCVSLSKKAAPTHRDFLLLGVAMGFAVLGRTDNVFLLIGVGLALLLWRPLPLARRVVGAGLVGVMTTVITLPWFAWNLLNFGSIMQVSGQAFPYLERQLFLSAHNSPFLSPATLNHAWGSILEGTARTVMWLGFGLISTHLDGSALSIALLASVGGLTLLDEQARTFLLDALKRLWFLFFFLALLFFYHLGYRWVYREWYILPMIWTSRLLIALFFAGLVSLLHSNRSRQQAFTLAATIMGVALLFHSVHVWQAGVYPGQYGLINQANAVNQLPEGARVALSDSGYVGWAANRPIVNLDGVVNNQAADAFMHGRLMGYLLDNDIEYVLSQPRYLDEQFYGPDFQRFLRPDGLFYKVMGEAEQQAYLQLPDDSRIDLGGEVGWKYLGSGWSREETPGEGVWADSLQANVFVVIPSLDEAQPYTLQLRAKPFSHGASEPQRVTVMVNGAQVGEPLVMDTEELALYGVALPAALLHDGVNSIEFHFLYKNAPNAVGFNADTRTLAVWVDYIEVSPAD